MCSASTSLVPVSYSRSLLCASAAPPKYTPTRNNIAFSHIYYIHTHTNTFARAGMWLADCTHTHICTPGHRQSSTYATQNRLRVVYIARAMRRKSIKPENKTTPPRWFLETTRGVLLILRVGCNCTIYTIGNLMFDLAAVVKFAEHMRYNKANIRCLYFLHFERYIYLDDQLQLQSTFNTNPMAIL